MVVLTIILVSMPLINKQLQVIPVGKKVKIKAW